MHKVMKKEGHFKIRLHRYIDISFDRANEFISYTTTWDTLSFL